MSASRFAYLGPEGTFTESALRTLPEAATRELVPMVSVSAALDAVRAQEVEAALVPIENSVEGGVTGTIDELTHGTPLMIFREVRLPIAFALLALPGTAIDDIKTVTGHPVAQPQVRHWLRRHLPYAQWESAASNAEGARLVQEGRYDAAFAGVAAAARYALEPLVTGIHDAENAETRFVLVGRPAQPAAPTGHDRTSVVVWLSADGPSALLGLLQQLAVRGVDLLLIQSRPVGGAMGHYCFAIDAAGHVAERHVGEALMGLKRIAPKVRFLGSYPRADAPYTGTRPARRDISGDSVFTAAADWLNRIQGGRD
ncbi:prephenate dehydratase [Streptomyces sp. NPDC048301]|uniref:prephenate dehydratase n=1 Tax=Streptomyces sp. NPDC048301 TaxID=3155631 RepID=UPI0034229BF4